MILIMVEFMERELPLILSHNTIIANADTSIETTSNILWQLDGKWTVRGIDNVR